MYVPNLTTTQVNSPEDLQQLINLGSKNRASAATNCNEHSSRSHSYDRILLELIWIDY